MFKVALVIEHALHTMQMEDVALGGATVSRRGLRGDREVCAVAHRPETVADHAPCLLQVGYQHFCGQLQGC